MGRRVQFHIKTTSDMDLKLLSSKQRVRDVCMHEIPSNAKIKRREILASQMKAYEALE